MGVFRPAVFNAPPLRLLYGRPLGLRVGLGRVLSFDGLLVDFLKQQDAKIVFRGLRAVTDFEYELQMAQTNHSLYPEMETVFLTANVQYSYLSSTIVKDVLVHNGDISNFVPAPAIDMIKQFRR